MIEAGSEINSSFIRSELIDEFVFDRDIESKKQHGLAYSFRFVYNPFIMEKDIFTLFTSIMHVGSPTFRHYKGSNNFVAGGQPLGWINGSDSRDLSIGINYLKSEKKVKVTREREIANALELIGGRKKPGCPVEQVGQKVTIWVLRDWDKYKNHTANELGRVYVPFYSDSRNKK